MSSSLDTVKTPPGAMWNCAVPGETNCANNDGWINDDDKWAGREDEFTLRQSYIWHRQDWFRRVLFVAGNQSGFWAGKMRPNGAINLAKYVFGIASFE